MTYHNPIFEKISEEKKDRILQAAISEFSHHGFSKANINVIAKEASVSVGSLYKYFNNKHDMYLYIISVTVDKIKNILSEIIQEDLDLIPTVRKIIRAIQTYSREDEKATRLYNVMATEMNTDLVWQLASRMEGATADVYASLIKKHQSSGQLRPDVDVRYFAYFLDNLFMMLQFSYTCEYYKQRMKLYITEDVFDNDSKLEDELIKFIRGAFGLS